MDFSRNIINKYVEYPLLWKGGNMLCYTGNSFIMDFLRNIINKLLLNIHYYGKVKICYVALETVL